MQLASGSSESAQILILPTVVGSCNSSLTSVVDDDKRSGFHARIPNRKVILPKVRAASIKVDKNESFSSSSNNKSTRSRHKSALLRTASRAISQAFSSKGGPPEIILQTSAINRTRPVSPATASANNCLAPSSRPLK